MVSCANFHFLFLEPHHKYFTGVTCKLPLYMEIVKRWTPQKHITNKINNNTATSSSPTSPTNDQLLLLRLPCSTNIYCPKSSSSWSSSPLTELRFVAIHTLQCLPFHRAWVFHYNSLYSPSNRPHLHDSNLLKPDSLSSAHLWSVNEISSFLTIGHIITRVKVDLSQFYWFCNTY